MTQPNILFFMTDQQRADAMGCSGELVGDSQPRSDCRGRACRFSRCVTTTPICVPARVTLATGRYPHNNAVWNNLQYTLPEDALTWMRVIRDLGYRTSLFGKTHLHPHGKVDLREREYLLHAYGLDDVNEIGGPRASANVGSHMTAMWEEKGLLEAYRADFKERFDNKPHVVRPSVLPLEDYYDVYVGQCAKRYLEEYDRREPWFCWVSFGGPSRTLGHAGAVRQHVRTRRDADADSARGRRPRPAPGLARRTSWSVARRNSIPATRRPCARTTPAT